MAALKEDLSKRRRSIAVTNQTKKAVAPSGRRRAHSIAPGERLSDLDKSRRPSFVSLCKYQQQDDIQVSGFLSGTEKEYLENFCTS